MVVSVVKYFDAYENMLCVSLVKAVKNIFLNCKFTVLDIDKLSQSLL